jgi:hypothetical protein
VSGRKSSPGALMASCTYDLFFTGRDDPRSCVIIGEDTKPVYFCFETAERNLMPNVRTMVSQEQFDKMLIVINSLVH